MDSQSGVVDPDNIADSVNDWEVLESGSVDNNLSPLLLVFWVEGWVNDLNRADESVAINFVWEGGVSDNTVEVHWISGGEGSLVKLNILVL